MDEKNGPQPSRSARERRDQSGGDNETSKRIIREPCDDVASSEDRRESGDRQNDDRDVQRFYALPKGIVRSSAILSLVPVRDRRACTIGSRRYRRCRRFSRIASISGIPRCCGAPISDVPGTRRVRARRRRFAGPRRSGVRPPRMIDASIVSARMIDDRRVAIVVTVAALQTRPRHLKPRAARIGVQLVRGSSRRGRRTPLRRSRPGLRLAQQRRGSPVCNNRSS